MLNENRYCLHLDFDYPVPEHWITLWETERRIMLKNMGYLVERVIIKDPKEVDEETRKTVYKGRKGKHVWIHILSPTELTEEEINMLQWLCGDDPVRVNINRMRIDRGLRKYWNKLFSRAVWIRPLDKKCEKCKIRRILNEMRKHALDS